MAIPSKFSGREIKTLVFANDAAPITLFTLTGTVIVNITCVSMVSVVSGAAGSISVGIAGAGVAALIANTLASTIIAGEIWHDAAADAEIELSSVIKESIISDGNNIILTPSAQIDTGTLAFYCCWVALSADGLVVATA